MPVPAGPLPELETRVEEARAAFERVHADFLGGIARGEAGARQARIEALTVARRELDEAEAELGLCIAEVVAAATTAGDFRGTRWVRYGVAIACSPAIDRAVRMLEARGALAGDEEHRLIGWAAMEFAAGRGGRA